MFGTNDDMNITPGFHSKIVPGMQENFLMSVMTSIKVTRRPRFGLSAVLFKELYVYNKGSYSSHITPNVLAGAMVLENAKILKSTMYLNNT